MEAMEVSLESLATSAGCVDGVRAGDVQPGDWIIVRTRNSTYSLLVNDDGTFDATGGWFSREEQSGARLRVAGCTSGRYCDPDAHDRRSRHVSRVREQRSHDAYL